MIPQSVFEKPPSAELRPDQKDTDSLPDYDTLDAILREYVEHNRTPAEISAHLKLPLALTEDIAAKVNRNEYKRQQAAPAMKITSKAFGMGRRFPIAQKYVRNVPTYFYETQNRTRCSSCARRDCGVTARAAR